MKSSPPQNGRSSLAASGFLAIQFVFDQSVGQLGRVDRHIVPLDKGGKALDMVDMFVGQQDRIQHIDAQADLPQRGGQPPDRDAQVDQDAGISVHKQAAVPRRTAGDAEIIGLLQLRSLHCKKGRLGRPA